MWLSSLSIENCRNITKADLKLCPTINYIYGDNGSGKTSLLEALSMISIGRSFRTVKIKQVINHRAKKLTTTGRLCRDEAGHESYPIGITKNTDTTTIKINKQFVYTQAKLSRHLPLTVIHPLSYELITGSARLRRHYIDWMAFYLNDDFHPIWLKYQKILKQRNAALRQSNSHYALDHLTVELCSLQPLIHQARTDAIELLQQTLNRITPDNLAIYIPDIRLQSGFPMDVSLDTESLINYYQSQRHNELRMKRTLKGSHLADILLTRNGEPVASSASRGQTKMIAILLLVAQSLTIKESGVLAFDDLHSELDSKHYNDIMLFIESSNRQVFVTSIAKPKRANTKKQHRMFHVKQGCVKECE
ncbi:MAG: DNA replication and repair protein RecF [Thiotrichaceae bacterium]|nr:DNA replication and repair protein RecF [Thiotrichaceae bacterium]